MSGSRKALLTFALCFTVALPIADGLAQCSETAIQQSKERSVIAAPEYAKQIQLARRPLLKFTTTDSWETQAPRSKGFGFADLEQCVPVVPKTKFRIGSTSKPLTSAGAALLYEQNRLDLDAPIQKYVPGFPDKGFAITTRQLLGHLGGIRGYTAADGDTENVEPYHSVTESLKRFKEDPLIAPPGTKWQYSSYGYVLASAAIEGASGQDFLSFMHDKVFQPLGMSDTLADENDRIIPDRSRSYRLAADGTYRNSPYTDLSYKWAAVGFLSTAIDLVRFGSALLQSGFLRKTTLTMVFSPQDISSGTKTKLRPWLGDPRGR